MNKLVFTILVLIVIFKINGKAQSTFTTSIISVGAANSCDSLILKASTLNNIWIQKANFGAFARANAVGFSIGNKGYVGTGFNGTYTNDFWEYDPVTNAWTQKANFGAVARANAVGFSIGNKGYIGTGGGLTTGNYNDFWEYDPITNVWTIKAYFVGGPRVNATGFSIGNKGYLGTGKATISGTVVYYNDLWEYDPITDAWTQKANVGGPLRIRATGFSIGSKGYIGLGGDSLNYFNDFWEYDPATNAWLQRANFSGGARANATGINIGCKGYVGLGYNGATYYNDFWEYNPASNLWASIPSLPAIARAGAVGFSIGSKGYVGTGRNATNYYQDFWEYNPTATYLWSSGATTQSITAYVSGTYSLTVTLPGCTSATAIQTVNIGHTPTISVNSTSICLGNNAVITPTVNPTTGITYSWTPSNSTTASISVSPTINTTYTVKATDLGCSSSAVCTVSVYPTSTVSTNFSYTSPICKNATNPLPNPGVGFTPNGVYSSSSGLILNASTGLIDLTNSSAGNYVVTYSIAANACILASSSSSSITILNPTNAVTNFSYASPICSSQGSQTPINITGFSNGGTYSGSSGLIINPSTGVIDVLNSPIGTYTVNYAVNASGCVLAGSGSTIVTINPTPTITVNADTTIIASATATLSAISSTNTYTWNPTTDLSCVNCQSVAVSPTLTTQYCVTTTNGLCTATTCVIVNVELNCSSNYELELPNAFSPNGDGNNDLYCLQGWDLCVTDFRIIIYDRWGEKVFESNDPAFCWDGMFNGKVLNPAVFIYDAKALYNKTQTVSKKGNITLIK